MKSRVLVIWLRAMKRQCTRGWLPQPCNNKLRLRWQEGCWNCWGKTLMRTFVETGKWVRSWTHSDLRSAPSCAPDWRWFRGMKRRTARFKIPTSVCRGAPGVHEMGFASKSVKDRMGVGCYGIVSEASWDGAWMKGGRCSISTLIKKSVFCTAFLLYLFLIVFFHVQSKYFPHAFDVHLRELHPLNWLIWGQNRKRGKPLANQPCIKCTWLASTQMLRQTQVDAVLT